MSMDQPRDWATLIRRSSLPDGGADQSEPHPDVVAVHLPSLVRLLENAWASSRPELPRPSDQSPLLTTKEAALCLGTHAVTLSKRLREGLVPEFCYHQSVAGGRYQISAAAVQHCLVYGSWPKNRRKLSQFIRETDPSTDDAWKKKIEAKITHIYEYLDLI